MGVKDLWPVLSQVQQLQGIEQLKGKKLAVDISTWFYQSERAQGLRNLQGIKPHLRQLFGRIRLLQRHHVRVVIVFEGAAPQKKQATLDKRAEMKKKYYSQQNDSESDSHGAVASSQSPVPSWRDSTRPTLPDLQAFAESSQSNCSSTGSPKKVTECCALLDALGVPHLTAPGEAEVFCAALEKNGLIDGTITDDSDYFLFGGRTVYRNFTVDSAVNKTIEYYCMSDIESRLHLSREKLVAMALLTGCDYDAEGVKGVGKEQAVQFLQNLPSDNVLERLQQWSHPDCALGKILPPTNKPSHCGQCGHTGSIVRHRTDGCRECKTSSSCVDEKADSTSPCPCDWHRQQALHKENACEIRIRQKVLDSDKCDFPDQEVIDIYLGHHPINGKLPESLEWKRPNFGKLKTFLLSCFPYNEDAAIQKVLPILTAWDMMIILQKQQTEELNRVGTQPKGILASRCAKKRKVFDVQWKHIDDVPDEILHRPSKQQSFECESLPPGVSDEAAQQCEQLPPDVSANAVNSAKNIPLGVTEEYQADMESAFPWVVQFFHNERAPAKGKRKTRMRDQVGGKQMKIDRMFQARKRLNFTRDISKTSEPANDNSGGAGSPQNV